MRKDYQYRVFRIESEYDREREIFSETHEVGNNEASLWANEEAWKRAGFKDRDALMKAVRSLPLEEKVDLLIEEFLETIALRHLSKKMAFSASLGKKVYVSDEEIKDYLKKTYVDGGIEKGSKIRWKVREYGIESVWVNPNRGYPDIFREEFIDTLLKNENMK